MKKQSIVEFYQEQLNSPASPSAEEVATREMSTFYSVMGNLPNPDPILKKAGKDITVYENLEYDDQVGMCVEALELSIQALPWEIDANGGSDSWAQELEAMMEDWDNERIFSEAVKGRLFGYQPMEALWNTSGKIWHIEDIVGKPPEWFFFDDQNRLRLRSKKDYPKGILADHANMPYKFILPRHKASYKNPYGKAALSLCFWPVAFKKGGLKFWLKMIEKYGIPFLIGKQPRNAGDQATEKLLDQLENMVQDAVGVIPDDSSVEILEAGGKGASGDLFEKHVNYHDNSIAKAIIGQTLTSSSGQDGSGSYALGKVHLQVFDNVRDGTAKLVQKVYNQAFAWLTEVNKGSDVPAPKLKWVEDEDVQKDRAERDKTLKETGIKFTRKYYANWYNLDEDEFELEETQEPPANQFSHISKKGGVLKQLSTCRCGCGGEPVIHFENSVADEFPDQAAIDKAGEDSPGRKRELQVQGERLATPIVDLINESESYEEVFEKLAGLYPDLDADRLEEKLSRALFVSEIFGRVSAEDEAGDPDGN